MHRTHSFALEHDELVQCFISGCESLSNSWMEASASSHTSPSGEAFSNESYRLRYLRYLGRFLLPGLSRAIKVAKKLDIYWAFYRMKV
jgi:hypothetical protein